MYEDKFPMFKKHCSFNVLSWIWCLSNHCFDPGYILKYEISWNWTKPISQDFALFLWFCFCFLSSPLETTVKIYVNTEDIQGIPISYSQEGKLTETSQHGLAITWKKHEKPTYLTRRTHKSLKQFTQSIDSG